MKTAEHNVTIPGVPESITRDQFISMIRSLGLDPYRLTDLKFGYHAIVATVKAVNPEGNEYLDPFERNALAKHTITIPIVDFPIAD